MRVLNGWFATTLVAIATAFAGYLAEMPYDWFSVRFPLPIVNKAHDPIYLADFSYFGFLASTVYWIALGRLGKVSPSRQNLCGVLLGVSVAIFAAVAIDFLVNFLPKTAECQATSLGNGITMRQCVYANELRNWLALAGAACLFGSLIASMKSRVYSDAGDSEAFQ